MIEGHAVMAPSKNGFPFLVNPHGNDTSFPFCNPIPGMETMRQRLIALREARGLTRDEVAAQAKVPKTTLQTLEDKDQTASKWLVQLANFYGVSPFWLQTGKGSPDMGDNVRHLPVQNRQQVIDPINEKVSEGSRVLRLDPVMIRDGYKVVANFFEAAGGVFRVDVDADLMARAYEWARTGDNTLLTSIDADVRARIEERRGKQGDGRQDAPAKRRRRRKVDKQ